MATQTLELTLRRQADGYRFRPRVRIAADPDDLETLSAELDRLVRVHMGRSDSSGYELIVEPTHARDFIVSGRERR